MENERPDSRITSIQLLRIVLCIGVFNGHFFGICMPHGSIGREFLSILRNGWLSRTVLCFWHRGDANVFIFFIISGFFIAYTLTDLSLSNSDMLKKLFKRTMNILLPSAIVILTTAFIYYLFNKIGFLGEGGECLFNKEEIIKDLKGLVYGGNTIPYYAYQLWYIRVLLQVYVRGFFFQVILRRLAFPIRLLVYSICVLDSVSKLNVTYFALFTGMLVAEITTVAKTKIGTIKFTYVKLAAVFAIIVAPFTYNEDNLSDVNAIIFEACMVLFILMICILEMKYSIAINQNIKKAINRLDVNSFAFYLLHVLVLNIFSRQFYNYFITSWGMEWDYLIVAMDYIVTFCVIWILSNVFENYIIKNINRFILSILNIGDLLIMRRKKY